MHAKTRAVGGAVVGLTVGLLLTGCPTAGSTGTRTDSRGVISGNVVLSDIPGLNDMSRVRVDFGRGEGGLTPNTDGYFESSDLEPDVYTVTVTYIGGLTPTASRSAYAAASARAVVRAGSSVSVGRIELVRAKGSVTGQVRDALGMPVPGATVVLEVERGDVRRVVAETGTFTVEEVPVGTHRVEASAPGHVQALSAGACSTGAVVVEDGQAADVGMIPLVRTDVTIQPGAAGIADTEGTTWFITHPRPAGGNVTANISAGFSLAQGRRWKAGETAPAYGPFEAGQLLPVEDGVTAWTFQFLDACGWESPIYTITLVADAADPELLLSRLSFEPSVLEPAESQPAVTRNAAGVLELDAVDDLGAEQLSLRLVVCGEATSASACDMQLVQAAPVPLQGVVPVALPGPDGTFTVKAQVVDRAGRTSDMFTGAVVLDTSAPVITGLSLAGGAMRATSPSVQLAVTLDEVGGDTGAVQVRAGNGAAVVNASWMPLAASVSLVLEGDDGDKEVLVQVRDLAGNTAERALTVPLVTRGTVSGTVRLESGATVAGARVTVPGTMLETTSGMGGTYLLAGVPVLSRSVHVEPPAELAARHRPVDLPVAVSAGEVLANVDALLPLRFGRAYGVVRFQGGSEHAGITVLATNVANATEVLAAVTTPSGQWSLDRVPAGAWSFSAQGAGHAPASLGQRDVGEGAQVNLGSAELTRREGDFSINGGAPFTNNVLVQLQLAYAGATRYVASESEDFSTATSEGAPGPSEPFTLSAAGPDGPRTVYVNYFAGTSTTPLNASPASASIILDRQAPVLSGFVILVDGGAAFTRDAAAQVMVTVPQSDALSGVNRVWLGTTTDRASATLFTRPVDGVVGPVALADPGVDGLKTLHAWLQDAAGNTTEMPLMDDIYLDRAAPALASPLSAAEAVAGSVRNANISLVMAAFDACQAGYPRTCGMQGFPAASMQVAHEMAFVGAEWRPFTSPFPWTLQAGDGGRTVCARFRDEAGNISDGSCLSVTVDTLPPGGVSVVIQPDGTTGAASAFTNNGMPAVRVLSGDGVAWRAASSTALLDAAAFTAGTFPVNTTVALDAPEVDGLKSVFVDVRDAAGNVTRAEGRITLDRTPPDAALRLQPASVTTSSDIVALFSGVDVPSGLARVAVSTTMLPVDAPTVAFTTAGIPVMLGTTVGERTVYGRVVDRAGNRTDLQATIFLDPTPPPAPAAPTVVPRAGRTLNASGTNDVSPALTWAAVTDLPAGGAPVRYTLELSRRADFNATLDPEFRAWRDRLETSVQVDALGEGTWHARVTARDGAGQATTGPARTFAVDSVVPAAPVVAFAGGAFVSSTTASVQVSTAETPAGLTAVIEGDITGAPVTAALTASPQAVSVTLTAGTDGPRTVRVKLRDAVGNESPATAANVTLDTVDPVNGVPQLATVNGGVTALGGATTLTIPCSDTNGIASVAWAVTAGTTGSGNFGTPQAPAASYALSLGTEGPYVVQTRCTDRAGRVSAVQQVSVVVDRTPPALVLSAPSTSASRQVAVAFSPAADITELAVSTTDLANCTGATFSAAPAGGVFTFTAPSDGTFTFYACARDRYGNTTATRATAGPTSVDSVAPATPQVSLPAVVGSTSVTLTLSTTDSTTTGHTVTVTGAVAAATSFAWTTSRSITLTSGEGDKTLQVRVTDGAGNASGTVQVRTRLDTTPPVISAVTAPPSVRGTQQVTLGVEASTDAFSTRTWQLTDPMSTCVGTSPACPAAGTYGADEPYFPTTTFTLSGASGDKWLCVRVCDAAGNRTTFNAARAEAPADAVAVRYVATRPAPTLASLVVLDPAAGGERPDYPVMRDLELELRTGGGPGTRLVPATVADDTSVLVGALVLPCTLVPTEGGDVVDLAERCNAQDANTCVSRCRFRLPAGVRNRPGSHPVRLQTPGPVEGLGLSDVAVLDVVAPVPRILSTNIRGVRQDVGESGPVPLDLGGDPNVRELLVCAAGIPDGAFWSLGNNRLTPREVVRVDTAGNAYVPVDHGAPSAPRRHVCPPGSDALIVLDGDTAGLFPEGGRTVPLRVEVAPPGGGVAEVAFGINPSARSCVGIGPTACGASVTHVASPVLGGLGVSMDLRAPSEPSAAGGLLVGGFGLDAWDMRDSDGRTLVRHVGGRSFVPAPLGVEPASVGLQDMAVRGARGTWRTSRGRPTGVYPTAAALPVSPVLSEVESAPSIQADLDGDGLAEVIAAYATSDLIRVFGVTPSVGLRQTLQVEAPIELAAADWNMDGRLDIVVMGITGGLSIFIADAAGGFADRLDFTLSTAATTWGLEVADMDGDLLPDVLVGDFDVRLHRGLPGGGLETGVAAATLDGSGIPGVARVVRRMDANGDVFPDVVALKRFEAMTELLVSLGAPGVPLSRSSTVPLPACAYATGMAVLDIGQDGVQDVVVLCQGGLQVVQGDGLGALLPGALMPMPASPPSYFYNASGLSVADLDMDGAEDVLACGQADGDMGLAIWRPGAAAGPPVRYAAGATGNAWCRTPQAVLVPSHEPVSGVAMHAPWIFLPTPGALGVFLPSAATDAYGLHAGPALASSGSTLGANRVHAVRLAPGLSVPDRVWIREAAVTVERGVFSPAGGLISSATPFPGGAHTYQYGDSVQGFPKHHAPTMVAEVTGDNFPDLVVLSWLNTGGSALHVLPYNQGAGTFGAATTVSTTAVCNGAPVGAVVTNVDLNDHADVVFTCVPGKDMGGAFLHPHRVVLLRGSGGGGFVQSFVDLPQGTLDMGRALGVAAADLNGDVYPEVVVAVPGVGIMGISNTSGNLGVVTSLVSEPGHHRVYAADTNRDGRVDILAQREETPAGAHEVVVYLGNGMGGLARVADHVVAGGELGLVVADVNGDHVPDVLAHDGPPAFQSGLSVSLGTGDGRFGKARRVEAPAADYGFRGDSLAVTDVNGDGTRDVVFTQASGDGSSNTQSTLVVAAAAPAQALPGAASPARQAFAFDAMETRAVVVPAGATLPGAVPGPMAFHAAPLVVEDVSVNLTLDAASYAGVVVALTAPSGEPGVPGRTVILNDGDAGVGGCQPGLLPATAGRRTLRFTGATSCGALADLAGGQPGGWWRLQVTAGGGPITVTGARVTLLGHHQRPNRDGLAPDRPVDARLPPAPGVLTLADDLFGAVNAGGCGAGPDRWAEVVAPRTGTLSVRMVGDFDSVVGVAPGSCAAPGAWTCVDDSVGRSSFVQAPVTAGLRYCINLAAYPVGGSSTPPVGAYRATLALP